MNPNLAITLLVSASTVLIGCGTLNAARPLEAGAHQLGVTFGGPFTTSLGPPIPVPNLILEGRSGLAPFGPLPADVNYGLNMTALAFGVVGIHGGGSLHLVQGVGFRPALSVTERLHFYNNWLDLTKPKDTRKAWAVHESDVTLSWLAGPHVLYLGATNAIDIADPELLVGPFIGVQFRPQERRFSFQLESRLVGANFTTDVYDATWVSPGEPGNGLVTFTLSAAWQLGKMRASQ